LEGSGHGPILRNHPSIYLERLRKTTKNQSGYPDFRTPEYEAGMLTNRPQCSVVQNAEHHVFIATKM